jgi:hypothetical protein
MMAEIIPQRAHQSTEFINPATVVAGFSFALRRRAND